MKKILFIISFITLSIFTNAQSGEGWVAYRAKSNFRDSVNFTRSFRLGNITVTATGLEFNMLAGVTSNIQTQLNTKAPIANPTFTGVVRLGTDTLATRAYARSEGGGGSGSYPGAGIALSTGSAWGTSITNNSTNWNTAYTERRQWDGSSTNLVAATGRTSLGGTTLGSSLFTLSNPSIVSFLRINADNTVTALSLANFKTVLSLSPNDVLLGNVTNESKATMFTNPQFTGIARLSTDTLATKPDARNIVGDSLLKARSTANLATNYFVQKQDTNGYGGDYVTRPYLESRLGSGGSGFSYYSKEFTVGDTGFPAVGDSTITSADWIGRDVKVWRDGLLQRRRTTANGLNGARINNITGQVTVHPPFEANQEVIIEGTDPTARYEATISGTENSLLTGLVAFWQLDETSGIVANDVLGILNGSNTNVTVNAVGRFGKAFQYSGTGYTNMGTASALRVQAHTISFSVNTTQTGSFAGLVTNFVWGNSRYNGYAFTLNDDGTIDYDLQFTDGTSMKLTSTSTVNNGTNHHIMATWSGTTAYLYIDNIQQDTETTTAKTIIYHANCSFHFGDRNETDLPYTGIIDAVGIFSRVVTSGERTDLYSSTYPW